MGAIELIVIIVVLGLIVWAIYQFTPIPIQFKKAILWIAIIIVILLALSAFGILGKDVRIPSIR